MSELNVERLKSSTRRHAYDQTEEGQASRQRWNEKRRQRYQMLRNAGATREEAKRALKMMPRDG